MNKQMNENVHESQPFAALIVNEFHFVEIRGKKCNHDMVTLVVTANTEVNNNYFSSDKIICAAVFARSFMQFIHFFTASILGMNECTQTNFHNKSAKCKNVFGIAERTEPAEMLISDVMYQNVLSSQCTQ